MTAAALPPVVDADTWQRQLDALRGLGDVHLRQGRYGPAADHYEQFGTVTMGYGDLFVAGLLVYLGIVYAGDQMWVGARPGATEDVVELTRVHPEFVRALQAVG